MQLSDAIALIQTPRLISAKPVKWADLGCGSGLFTRALASFLPSGSTVYAVDTIQLAIADFKNDTGVSVEIVRQDFVRDDWSFATLDGILMANSLHYVEDKLAFFQKANRYLSETGCFLLVEYDTDVPNPWVPYPLSYSALQQLVTQAGYASVEKLHEKPSLYGRANLYASYISRL
ncbi:class I SAM-dependent methyltransferase [Spirosoma sp. KNUC1025]|uniref:class I SAM-dependent DNA methyltransferase n=1 Tax=Spirosoma sp. KNUC1025 TaxID=2894082 RepID=UPI0038685AB9|nr:class I SAM-dependent methyltransferase [Spirosoma sp. KNUC1025]